MSLVQQLFVGSLCASAQVEHLRWFVGSDTEEIDRAVSVMNATWCRTARFKSRVQSDLRGCRSPRGGDGAGRPRHGIAIALVKRPRPPDAEGLLVREVREGSPAARADLAHGDLIVSARAGRYPRSTTWPARSRPLPATLWS